MPNAVAPRGKCRRWRTLDGRFRSPTRARPLETLTDLRTPLTATMALLEGKSMLITGEFSCFLELPVEAENSQPTNQSLNANFRN
jgi:hypothetical protein